jgi:hypothetical protein
VLFVAVVRPTTANTPRIDRLAISAVLDFFATGYR